MAVGGGEGGVNKSVVELHNHEWQRWDSIISSGSGGIQQTELFSCRNWIQLSLVTGERFHNHQWQWEVGFHNHLSLVLLEGPSSAERNFT